MPIQMSGKIGIFYFFLFWEREKKPMWMSDLMKLKTEYYIYNLHHYTHNGRKIYIEPQNKHL